jgi:hypothetical protein
LNIHFEEVLGGRREKGGNVLCVVEDLSFNDVSFMVQCDVLLSTANFG